MHFLHQQRLGLALGGGGARGLAHIGVLKALEEADIHIDYLSGTSMGGVIASAYAAGMTVEQIEAVAREYADTRTLMRLADPTLPRQGLFKGEQLEAFFRKHLGERTFQDLNIPTTLVAVDLNSGKEIHLNEGDVASAVRATVSVPGLLTPVERDGMRLVDGGLLNNVPVDVVRNMGADVVIAVDVNATATDSSYWQLLSSKRLLAGTVGGLIAILGDSLDLLMRQQTLNKLHQSPPDFLLTPQIPTNITVISGYDQAERLIQLGAETTHPILKELNEMLSVRLFGLIHKHTSLVT